MRIALLITCSLFGLAAIFAMSPSYAATVSTAQELSFCGYSGVMQLPDGASLKIRLALSDADKKQGLSGIRKEDFAEDEALLIVNFNNDQRSINMGDTWFDIDVFFLDNDLVVVGLQRNLKAHPGRAEPPPIENSAWVFARHTMEMRSGSRYARRIEQGMRLQWRSQPTVKEIEQCMAEVWNREHGRGGLGNSGRSGFK